MDQGPPTPAADPVVVTGRGTAWGSPCDPTPWLKVRKNRKFMGTQDDLAVAAAGMAAQSAGLAACGERAGLYLAVGYIPFEEADLAPILAGSVDSGAFSMARFSTDGYSAANPLLTFRCLSNMPAFHVSMNLDIQGPYLVTYPGPGQFYLALEEARAALVARRVDVAFVGAVAHQTNFLVMHHFSRIDPPASALADVGAFLVLERPGRARPVAALRSLDIAYRAHDPFEESIAPSESALGPASLPALLGAAPPGPLHHAITTRDGITASSTWEVFA